MFACSGTAGMLASPHKSSRARASALVPPAISLCDPPSLLGSKAPGRARTKARPVRRLPGLRRQVLGVHDGDGSALPGGHWLPRLQRRLRSSAGSRLLLLLLLWLLLLLRLLLGLLRLLLLLLLLRRPLGLRLGCRVGMRLALHLLGCVLLLLSVRLAQGALVRDLLLPRVLLQMLLVRLQIASRQR